MQEPAVPRRKPVIEAIEPLLSQAAEAQGVTLYDLEYVKEGGDRILRLYIDKEGGVDINDCERVSHGAEAALDARDPIPEAYLLEVSSPGIERRLRKDWHFERYTGERVTVKLFKPAEDNRKKFKGILKGLRDGAVVIEEDGREIILERQQVSKCCLAVFD
ncbi:MAG: ribosome maturation factor RimP [Clostridiales bacterium]|jgi:ribosome maturation factor RimP|nr:ribosome maturation factor RimP [Clostridiales bacterium]